MGTRVEPAVTHDYSGSSSRADDEALQQLLRISPKADDL